MPIPWHRQFILKRGAAPNLGQNPWQNPNAGMNQYQPNNQPAGQSNWQNPSLIQGLVYRPGSSRKMLFKPMSIKIPTLSRILIITMGKLIKISPIHMHLMTDSIKDRPIIPLSLTINGQVICRRHPAFLLSKHRHKTLKWWFKEDPGRCY